MGLDITMQQSKTLDNLKEFCLKQTKTQNGFTFKDESFFFEIEEQLSDGTVVIGVYLSVGVLGCELDRTVKLLPSGLFEGVTTLYNLPIPKN